MALTWDVVDAIEKNYATAISSKRFYAIFPNGTKVELTTVCDRIIADPSLRPMKTMGDLDVGARLVLVVEATNMNPDGTETIYWRQAFYFSTGTSSDMANTWLPFDGIVLGDPPDSRRLPGDDDSKLGRKPEPGESRVITKPLWFDKMAFVRDKNPTPYFENYDDPLRVAYYLYDTGSFIPEKNYADRHGPLSYAVASYILGGGAWARRGLDPTAVKPSRGRIADYPGLAELKALLAPARPPQECFLLLATNHEILPYSKIAEINAYIGMNKAVSYMNMFWGSGLEDSVPMPKDVEVIANFRGAQYLIPMFFLVNRLRAGFRTILINSRAGNLAGDLATLMAARQAVVEDAVTIRPAMGLPWNFLESMPNLVFTISEEQAHHVHTFGGRRKKRKTVRRKAGKAGKTGKARKGKSLRRRR